MCRNNTFALKLQKILQVFLIKKEKQLLNSSSKASFKSIATTTLFLHLSLLLDTSSAFSIPIILRSFLIVSTHLCLGRARAVLCLISSIALFLQISTRLARQILLLFMILIILASPKNLFNSSFVLTLN